MAKQLLLIRHGKSDHGNINLKDFDRPLNHTGNKNAHCMAERCLSKAITTSILVSSPALRALTTAKHFAQVWNRPEDSIITYSSIYEADTRDLLQVVNGLSNDYHSAALFGHNPGFTDFANYLSDAKIYNIPTSGIVLLHFDTTDWGEISYHTGTVLLFDFPKKTEEPQV
ncbi:phosphohistidine phosphatase [Pedobacter sp. CAN_A7]|uniref:SixA phosphatase family protein n=1 Tax=Pedobacter sp. CAN_A7 TaxID=2787722 RepID=UPI0018C9975A